MANANSLPSLSFCFMVIGFGHCFLAAHGQSKEDSVRLLQEIIIEAYAADRSPEEIPASIGLVNRENLDRFSGASLVPAFNMLPGVRMEERSPGSYRFSIRGSLLRSPFGVRNVKFYWNGLPLTDGGGNTYLNVLDQFTLNRAEVIKGPAGSLYGAGTGGAVLLRSPKVNDPGAEITAQYGGFGNVRYGAAVEAKGESVTSRVQFVRQQGDGYRTQSAMKRNAFNADLQFDIASATSMVVTLLYTDLYYQTPGGLTDAQYQANPSQARPSTPTLPGAVEQQAAVYNSTWYTGVTLDHQWSNQWESTLGLVTSNTDFKNPAIRNYEARLENNVGARLTNEYQHMGEGWKGKLVFGGEYQRFFSPIKVTDNISGVPGNMIISQDEVTADLAMGFLQAEVELRDDVAVTVGASVNYLQYEDRRLAPSPVETSTQKFNPVLSPRIAILKKISTSFSAYVSASKGFSPPTVAEVMPSTGVYNPDLDPETGWSYEIGLSGTVYKNIHLHLALYDFRLRNTIVLQRDSSGADYFVNAGNTEQRGVELSANWVKTFASFVQSLRLNLNTTYNFYRFGDYVNDGNDFSGNLVTGVAPFMAAIGADLATRSGMYCRVTGNFVDRMPLNDANTDYATSYFLLGARLGYEVSRRIPVDLFIGVDNLLDQRYSLGNDLNAAGKRYYNAAPTINFYGGAKIRFAFNKGQ